AAAASPECGFTLLRSSQQFGANGGRASLTAEASVQAACAWNAHVSDPWIRLRDAAAGTGTGTLNFSVDANPTTLARTGTIAIAWPDGDATFTVRQDG